MYKTRKISLHTGLSGVCACSLVSKSSIIPVSTSDAHAGRCDNQLNIANTFYTCMRKTYNTWNKENCTNSRSATSTGRRAAETPLKEEEEV